MCSLEEKMSTLIIKVEPIKSIVKHENSDNLSIAKIFDWEVVIRSGSYEVGQSVIYLPPDTVVSEDFEAKLFPEGSKVKLHKRRIRATKIRGFVSAGMIVSNKEFSLNYVLENVSKYEPQASEMSKNMQVGQTKKVKPDIKAFVKYTDIENGKFYDRTLQDGEEVYISCKLHGTSSRFGWFKTEHNTWYQKLLKFLRLSPEWTFAWGTRNVQIQSKLLKRHVGYKNESQGVDFGDVYTKMVYQYDLKETIPKGYAIYGEIVGSGVQKGYNYGCGKDEHKFFCYDVYNVEEKRWLNYDEFEAFTIRYDIPVVPEMYVGPYSRDKIDEYLTVNPLSNEVNEGIVVRTTVERSTHSLGRTILKFINPEYYLQKTTEFH